MRRLRGFPRDWDPCEIAVSIDSRGGDRRGKLNFGECGGEERSIGLSWDGFSLACSRRHYANLTWDFNSLNKNYEHEPAISYK